MRRVMDGNEAVPASSRSTRSAAPGRGARVVAVDAARGLALIGLSTIHFLPASQEATGEPTWSWILFSGDSAALLALLAGTGLALFTGGRIPHRSRQLRRARAVVATRAVLIFVLGMSLRYAMPADSPAVNILVYYGVFFLLAIPFLHLPPRALFHCAAVFALLSPVVILGLRGQLPAFASYNPTFAELFNAPGATTAQLLLTGTYPALAYLTYLLTGLGVGRLDLRHRQVQIRVLVSGLGLALLARLVSWLLLYPLGGYHQLVHNTPSGGQDELDSILVFGPDATFSVSWWWLAVLTPHTNTPLAITSSLGTGLAVLGFFLLISGPIGKWLVPLSAMGTMTLTLYSAQLVLLAFRWHEHQPYLWFMIYLTSALLFAWGWQHTLGQGPLERVVATAARSVGETTQRRPLSGNHQP